MCFATKTRERADPAKISDAEKTDLRQRLRGAEAERAVPDVLDQLRKKSRVEEDQAVLSYDVQAGQRGFNPDEE